MGLGLGLNLDMKRVGPRAPLAQRGTMRGSMSGYPAIRGDVSHPFSRQVPKEQDFGRIGRSGQLGPYPFE